MRHPPSRAYPSRAYLGAALLLLLASAATARAAAPPTAADLEAARLHYERATAAYGLGNYAEAALSYERAFELKPDPALLYNAAQAHRRAGNRPRAVALYRSFLQVFPRADNRELAGRHLAELERAAEPTPPTSTPPPLPASATSPPPVAPVPSPAAALADQARQPVWRRPWVWVAIGAGAVVAGTITAIALSGTDDPRPSWGRVGP